MSSLNRGSSVMSQEFYPTPFTTTNSILAEIDFTLVKSFTEPCKGSGAIYDLIDVPIKYHCELSEGTDYLKTTMPQVDLILTNPPFSLAKEFIVKSLTEAKCVIMLERINFLGSTARKEFWNSNKPTHLFVLANRPKFIAKCTNKKKVDNKPVCTDNSSYHITVPPQQCNCCGRPVVACSDSTEYAWFVWDTAGIIKKPNGIYIL